MSSLALPGSRIPRHVPKLSQFWVPTGGFAKSRPGRDEDATARLVRAGIVQPTAHAGLFQTLPLGTRIRSKLEALLDRRMQHDLGAAKLELSALSPADLWRASGRLPRAADGELFRLKDRKDTDFLLAPTHEEEITRLVAARARSPRDLPLRLYQVSRKYRDERRPRRGLLRAREFVMKDLYTFDADAAAARRTYDAVRAAYRAFFATDLRLPAAVADADSGSIGGDLSHEYHVLSPSGEDDLLMCDACGFCINTERAPAVLPRHAPTTAEDNRLPCPTCTEPLVLRPSIELAHAFLLGTKYSLPLKAHLDFPTLDGSSDNGTVRRPLEMGCYGVGVSRIIGAVAEVLSDAKGLAWPQAIAPFDVVVVESNEHVEPGFGAEVAQRLSTATTDSGDWVDAVLDDRQRPLGWKLGDADLIGYPVVVVLGRGVVDGQCEVQCRQLEDLRQDVSLADAPRFVGSILGQL